MRKIKLNKEIYYNIKDRLCLSDELNLLTDTMAMNLLKQLRIERNKQNCSVVKDSILKYSMRVIEIALEH